jgi:hypothetical protein
MTTALVNETILGLREAHPDPCLHLWALLDRWMTLDEARATWDEVETLYHTIMAIWRANPDEAEGWYLGWREVRAATLA